MGYYAEYFLYRRRISPEIIKNPRIQGFPFPEEKGLARCSSCNEVSLLTTKFPENRQNKQCPNCGEETFTEMSPEEYEEYVEEFGDSEEGDGSYY